MNLLHIKLKNGEDLLAQEIIDQTTDSISVTSPIQICIDPEHGFFIKSWASLSATDDISIPISEVMFCYPASEKAQSYYEEYTNRMSHTKDEFDEEEISEYEELFTALLEAKKSRLH